MTNENKLAQNIGKHIARRCGILDISQKELASRTGLTPSGISRYVSGERLPRIDILIKLSMALNCSLDYLVYGIEIQK